MIRADRQNLSIVGLAAPGGERPQVGRLQRVLQLLGEIPIRLHLRLKLAHALLILFPEAIGLHLRPRVYRWIGFRIGRHVTIAGNITFNADGNLYPRLIVGDDCFINTPLYVNANAPVSIGSGVTIAHHVLIVTDTHQVGPARGRAGKLVSRPITIGDGVWLCVGATILPGVTVGAGSIVAAGAVVVRDVPPNTMVAGVPARVVKQLPDGSERTSQKPRSAEDD